MISPFELFISLVVIIHMLFIIAFLFLSYKWKFKEGKMFESNFFIYTLIDNFFFTPVIIFWGLVITIIACILVSKFLFH